MSILKPNLLNIELTNRCNANCVYCGMRFGKRKPCDLDFEVYKRIVDSCPEARWVHPQDFGEPLLYPKIAEAVAYAKERGKLVAIFTNGSLLNPVLSRRLLETGLDRILFSVDASGPEIYEKLRPPLSWNKLLNNVETFQQIKKEHGYSTHTVARFTICPENLDQVDEIKSFWRQRVDFVIGQKEIDVPPPDLPALWSSRKTIICSRPSKHLSVKSNGDVVLCCRDWWGTFVMGNLYKEDPIEVFNSSKFKGIRAAMQMGRHYPSICDYCGRGPNR